MAAKWILCLLSFPRILYTKKQKQKKGPSSYIYDITFPESKVKHLWSQIYTKEPALGQLISPVRLPTPLTRRAPHLTFLLKYPATITKSLHAGDLKIHPFSYQYLCPEICVTVCSEALRRESLGCKLCRRVELWCGLKRRSRKGVLLQAEPSALHDLQAHHLLSFLQLANWLDHTHAHIHLHRTNINAQSEP